MLRFAQLVLVITAFFSPQPIHGARWQAPDDDCPPTYSPAPTESPAPSPSPSNVPTDTQTPSGSLYPSATPTDYPTTSEPSHQPSTVPTESPAPSPSPSNTPTESPSFSPSVSHQPTTSLSPSNRPSDLPTNAPSRSPSDYPSPSPSAFPTYAPSVSPRPTSSPSNEPSSIPSSSPTPNPTAIPSATPSEIPSKMPTIAPTTPLPSTSPSDSPSLSSRPSVSSIPSSQPSSSSSPTRSIMPSDQPSRAPSPAPTLSSEPSPVPSAIPTSTPSFSSAPSANPVFVSSSGNLINFQKVGSEMDAQQVTIFEQKMLDFLATKVQAPPGTLGINFINVKNTRQKLFASRRLAGSDDLNKEFSLSLAFDVEAMVVLDETSINVFDFTMLLKMFWANNADLLLLRNTLEESGVLQSGPTLQIPVQSDGGKPIQNKNVADSSDAAGSIAGALAGIIFSIAGSAMLFIWIRNRKNTPSQQHTTLALEPASYSSKDIEDQYAYSQNYEGSYDEESDPPTPRVLIKQCTYDGTKQIQYPAIGTLYPVESIETSLMPGASAYYKPALIPMESNIEIPDTPGAGYEPSNYEPSNYESSTFSPKDIKFGEFDLDSPLPDVSKKREIFAGEQKMFSPQRTTNFFSPSIFGTKRMVKDNKKKNSFDQHSKNGSAHSPVRNDIRKHGISGVKENTPKNNMSSDQSRDISIGIMDEVKYLHSTSKKKKTRRHANNDEASPEEVPRFFSKPFDPFGDFD